MTDAPQRARLVKVMVQPCYVLDDGEDVTEAPEIQPMVLTAAQWRSLDPTEWAEAGGAAVLAQLAPTEGGPSPA